MICALAVSLSAATADQTDPRLEALFAQLVEAQAQPEAMTAELQIWGIWLETSDEAVDALMLAGIEDMHRGNRHAALEAFDQVVEIAPDFAEGWNKRATVHYLLGNFDASLVDIERTLELEPRHFGALSGRGLIYVNLQDLERALDAFEAALAVHPQMTGPRVNAEAIREILEEREI